jgi:hypothetical protein
MPKPAKNAASGRAESPPAAWRQLVTRLRLRPLVWLVWLVWLAGLMGGLASQTLAGPPPLGPMLAPSETPGEAPAEGFDNAPLPALAARFRVTLQRPGSQPQVQRWQLIRSSTELSWIKGSATEEIWRRDASGIRLERVMRADRHLIDYSAGELRTLAVALDWRELASLFAAEDLALLGPPMPARPGQPARSVHYRGSIQGEQVDLLWDPVASLPIRLLRSGKSGWVEYQRSALHATVPVDWPRAGSDSTDFQRLDAADFGDMADNPVVRKAQARDERAGWRKHP